MNNQSEQFLEDYEQAEMLEFPAPVNVSMMPTVFRLTSIQHEQLDHRRGQYTATLYHDKAALKVCWTVSRPDIRLKSGVLVSPRWLGKTTCEGGMVRISRLVLLERPEPGLNLFNTVPHGWVENRELVSQAAELIVSLPRSYRFLFNAVFWKGQRFKRFCTGPSSINGHHAEDNGNLRHAVEVAEMMKQCCRRCRFDPPAGISLTQHCA